VVGITSTGPVPSPSDAAGLSGTQIAQARRGAVYWCTGTQPRQIVTPHLHLRCQRCTSAHAKPNGRTGLTSLRSRQCTSKTGRRRPSPSMALRGSAQTNRHAAPPPAVPAPHARTYKAQRPELPHTLRSRQCTSKSCRRRRSPSNPPNLSAKQQVRRSAPQAWTGLTFSFSCLLCFPCQLERLTQQAWSRQGRTKCQRAPWRGRRRAGELLAGTDRNLEKKISTAVIRNMAKIRVRRSRPTSRGSTCSHIRAPNSKTDGQAGLGRLDGVDPRDSAGQADVPLDALRSVVLTAANDVSPDAPMHHTPDAD
jgi:hypothetical protein